MGRMLFNLSVLGVIATGWLSTGLCGPPPIRPVTTIYRSSSVVTTQWSPTGNSFAAEHLSSLASTDRTGPPGLLPDTEVHSSPQSNGFSLSPSGNHAFSDSNHRPTIQQMQNSSGSYQLSHAGQWQNQHFAPNTYFGPANASWSNIQTPSPIPSSFESFNRFRPDTNSGAYFAPNNYLGPANNQWSNLSSGIITPHLGGGWNYQQY